MDAMVFEYKKWDEFCKRLHNTGMKSIPACEVTETTGKYIVLKHDVETDVSRAFELAKLPRQKDLMGESK